MTFLWQGYSLNNEDTYGIDNSYTKKALLKKLHHNGLFNIQATKISQKIVNKKLSVNQLCPFLSSVLSLLSSGISFQELLRFIQLQNKDIEVRFICFSLLGSLGKGLGVYDAFHVISTKFPRFFLTIIQASNQSGQLESGFRTLYEFYSEIQANRKLIIDTLRYPITITFIASIIIIGILCFVIPLFETIYKLNKELPFLTEVVIKMSLTLRENFFAFLFIPFIVWLITRIPFIYKSKVFYFFTKFFHHLKGRLMDPLLFSKSLQIMLIHNLPIEHAIQISAENLSVPTQKKIETILQKLYEGTSLADAFEKSRWESKIFPIFIQVAQKSESLETGFQELYNFFKKKLEQQFRTLAQIIEPLFMIILGIIVLCLLIAIYLPLFNLGSQL